MNNNFKEQLAEFARDLKAMCDANPHTCQHCPLTSADGCCKGGLLNSIFDPEATIAAVEAYRKRKKPCVEIIYRALDVYTIEVEVERGAVGATRTAKYFAEGAVNELQCYYKSVDRPATVRVLSAKRFVLESHRESDREERNE